MNSDFIMRELIVKSLEESVKLTESFLNDKTQINNIERAINLIVNALRSGKKILSCGNGGSLCDAAHFAEELSGRFREDRKALAAIALSDPAFLTCCGNDFGYEKIFSRGVEALGKNGDVLLAISTSGNSKNIVKAALKAKEMGISVVALTAGGNNKLIPIADVSICAPSYSWSDRIQEIHIKCIHIIVQGVEKKIFG